MKLKKKYKKIKKYLKYLKLIYQIFIRILFKNIKINKIK